jgi:hypothetical protein
MSGSFKPASAIQKTVASRAKAEELQKLQASTAAPTAEEAKVQELKEKAEEINDLLPKEVDTVFGLLKYDAFKERFAGVYQQVTDKDHLISGRISCTFTIAGMKVTLRSLRVRERAALIPLLGNPGADLTAFSQKESKYRLALLTLTLSEIGGHTIPEIKLTAETLDSWLANTTVMQTMDFISDMDETFVGLLMQLYGNMALAKQYALMESLKNQ